MEEAGAAGSALALPSSAWAERALDVLVERPGVRRAGLAVLEGGGRRLSFTSAEHPRQGPVSWCHVDAYDDVPLNTAVRTGRAVVGSLATLGESHPEFVERQRDTGTEALAAAPLVAAGRTVGAFVLFYSDARVFAEDVVRELYAAGAELGEALRRTSGEARRPPRGRAGASTPGAMVRQFAVPGVPAAVGPARRELREALSRWDVGPDTIDAAMLCMSELVTNAVVHAASGCRVHVANTSGTITVTVRSAGTPELPPDAATDGSLEVHGRGLALVDALASRWGSDLDGGAFTAWFALDA